jgi:hypothetical protein
MRSIPLIVSWPASFERRWNEARQVVYRIEGEIAAIEARKPVPLGEVERQQLMQLGADLALAWSHPATTSATRKRIVRAALTEANGTAERATALPYGGRSRKGADSLLRLALGHQLTVDPRG